MVLFRLIEDLGIPKKNRKVDILGIDMLGTVTCGQSVSLFPKRTGIEKNLKHIKKLQRKQNSQWLSS